MFQYEAKIVRIVDGDTLWLDIDLGFYTHRITDVRLAGINAPERVEYKLSGIEDRSKAFIEQWLPPGSSCIAEITTRDKYGRWLARILFLPGHVGREDIAQNGRCLNDELLANGLAEPYKK